MKAEPGLHRGLRIVGSFVVITVLMIASTVDRTAAFAAEANNKTADSAPKDAAQSPDRQSSKETSPNERPLPTPARENRNGVDPSDEKIAMKLVQSHLPELSKVIQQLRKNESSAYPRAIRDLARSAKRLELLEKRSDRLYAIELQLLKARTAVNLLTARLAVRDSRTDRKRLRAAIEQLQEAELARTRFEATALRRRLERTQKLLESANRRLDEQRQDRLKRLQTSYQEQLRRAGREAKSDTLSKSPNLIGD